MGIVYSLQTEPADVAADDHDLYALYRASDQLDQLCELVGLRPLSSFCYSDEAAAGRELARLFPDEPWAQGIHDAANQTDEWHPAAEGVEMIVALCELIMSNEGALKLGLSSAEERVLEELLFIADQLDGLSSGGRFRLTAVQ